MGSIPVEHLRFLGGFSDGLSLGFGPGPPVAVSPPPAALGEEMEELVRSPSETMTSIGKRVNDGGRGRDAKTEATLKSHSEAERRRRERINSHLSTLRGMIPCTEKLDKAALLAEVINNVKELEKIAFEVSKAYTVPSDADEVKVEVDGYATNSKNFIVKASICCEDKPDLLVHLKQSLQGLKLKTVRAEISSLGRRTKSVLVMMHEGSYSDDVEKHLCVASVHQALKSILDRVNSELDFLTSSSFSDTRRRISYLESSSCSS